jgi:hypothetical protein
LRLPNTPLYIKAAPDVNHGIVWAVDVDGPNVFGWSGGKLSVTNGNTTALSWNSSGVQVNTLTAFRTVFTNGSNRLVSRIGGSSAFYNSNGPVGIANDSWTNMGSIFTAASFGNGFLTWINQGTGWRNDIGETVLVNVSFACKRESNGFGLTMLRLRVGGTVIGEQVVGALDNVSISACYYLTPGQSLHCEAYQNSGSGNNIIAVRVCINVTPAI